MYYTIHTLPIPSKPTFLFPSLIQPINCSQPDLSTAQFPTHLPPFLTLACKNSQIFHMVFSIRELPDYFFRMLIFGPFSTYCDCCDCSRTAKERFPLFYFFLGCCSFFPNFFFPGFLLVFFLGFHFSSRSCFLLLFVLLSLPRLVFHLFIGSPFTNSRAGTWRESGASTRTSHTPEPANHNTTLKTRNFGKKEDSRGKKKLKIGGKKLNQNNTK